jgi:hypothetical protein
LLSRRVPQSTVFPPQDLPHANNINVHLFPLLPPIILSSFSSRPLLAVSLPISWLGSFWDCKGGTSPYPPPNTSHEETKDCRRSWKVVDWNLAWSTQSLLADPPNPFSIAIEHFRTVDLIGPVDLLLLPSLLQHPTFFRLFCRRRLHLDFRSSFCLKLYV